MNNNNNNRKRNKYFKQKKGDSYNYNKADLKYGNQVKSVVTTNVTKKETTEETDKSFQNNRRDIPRNVNSNKRNDNRQNERPENKNRFNNNNRRNQNLKKQNNYSQKDNRGIEPIRKKRPRTIIPYKINEIQMENCPICNKPINNMSTAIIDRATNTPAHFECILQSLKSRYTLKPNQRMTYVGSGGFAIIEDIRENGKMKFVIREKIQYLDKNIAK